MVTKLEIPWFYWPIYEEGEEDFLSSLVKNEIKREFGETFILRKYTRSSIRKMDLDNFFSSEKPLIIIHYWWSNFVRLEETSLKETKNILQKIRESKNKKTPLLITHFSENISYFSHDYYRPIFFLDVYKSENVLGDLRDSLWNCLLTKRY